MLNINKNVIIGGAAGGAAVAIGVGKFAFDKSRKKVDKEIIDDTTNHDEGYVSKDESAEKRLKEVEITDEDRENTKKLEEFCDKQTHDSLGDIMISSFPTFTKSSIKVIGLKDELAEKAYYKVLSTAYTELVKNNLLRDDLDCIKSGEAFEIMLTERIKIIGAVTIDPNMIKETT